MYYNFSKQAEAAVEYATKIASRSGGLIATEHLLAGVLAVDDPLAEKMQALGVPLKGVLGYIDMGRTSMNTVRVSENAGKVFAIAQVLATRMGSKQVYPVHFLLAILQTPCRALSIITSYNIDPRILFSELSSQRIDRSDLKQDDAEDDLFEDVERMYKNLSEGLREDVLRLGP